jgi:hypothetical protein
LVYQTRRVPRSEGYAVTTIRLLKISLFALLLPWPTFAQAKKPFVFVNVISDVRDANSQAVVPLLRQAMTQTGLFEVVSNDDSKLNLVVVTDCYHDSANDPFSCSYISNYVGAHKTLIGGGIVVQPTPDKAANAILASVAADISERWNSTNRSNLIEELEDCLLLTQSSCAVPDPLVAELHTKSINLSQYLRSA